MCGSFWTWGSWFRVQQAEGPVIRPPINGSKGGRLAARRAGIAAKPFCCATMSRSSRRVGGACRCRADSVESTLRFLRRRFQRPRSRVGADGISQAMEGSVALRPGSRTTPMDPDPPRCSIVGVRCTDDLGLVVVVGQAAISFSHRLITRAPVRRPWATKPGRLTLRNPHDRCQPPAWLGRASLRCRAQ